MTKADIEKLIEYQQEKLPKWVFEERKGIYCEIKVLFEVLRNYPVEDDKTCKPDFEAMYEHRSAELEKAMEHIDSLKFDLHNLSIEHAHYAGAVAAMETIFGRKFDPQR